MLKLKLYECLCFGFRLSALRDCRALINANFKVIHQIKSICTSLKSLQQAFNDGLCCTNVFILENVKMKGLAREAIIFHSIGQSKAVGTKIWPQTEQKERKETFISYNGDEMYFSLLLVIHLTFAFGPEQSVF